MAQLPAYDPADFTDKEFDASLLADIDSEFAAIKAVLDAARSNLATFQRDDTSLKNGSVHKDALAAETLSLFAAAWNPRGAWATATQYTQLDVVTNSGTWLCVTDHVSGTFATDQGNGLWMEITAEAANDTGLLRVTSAGTATAYTITTGNSYAQLADIPPMVVSWHVASGASPTVDVDTLGAKPLQVGTEAIAAGELEHDQLIVYDAAEDAFLLVVLESATATSPQIAAAVTTDTTITDGALATASHYIQPVDISSGSGQTIAVNLPTPAAANKHKFVSVRVETYTASSGNKVQFKDSLGTVLWEGEDRGDFATAVSDGSTWFLWDKEAHPITLRKSADYSVVEADLNAPLSVVAVDISAGDVLITLPTAVLLDGQIVRVYVATAGTGKLTVEQNNGVDLWIGVAKGDFVEVTANRGGPNYEVVAHQETIHVELVKSGDQDIAQGASVQLTGWTENADSAALFASDALVSPLNAWLDLSFNLLSGNSVNLLAPEVKIAGAYYPTDITPLEGTAPSLTFPNPVVLLNKQLSASDTVQLWAHNMDTDSGLKRVQESSTHVHMRLRWRY